MPDPHDYDHAALASLQTRLRPMFERFLTERLAPRTIVVVPGLSLDPDTLAKIDGVRHYEERQLSMLMWLRLPNTRIVFVTSEPLDPVIIDYYLSLVQGVPNAHARARLTLLSAYDSSPVTLTRKILERPRLVARIRAAIGDPSHAHLSVFNATALEAALAVQLGIPLYACDPGLARWGSKSGSREAFRAAGVELADGAEDLRDMDDVAEAIVALRQRNHTLRRCVVKHNEGFSGEGNAVFDVWASDTGASGEMPAMSGEGLTVAGVVFQSDTFMQTVQNGLQAAADEAGVDLILGNTENDLAKESSMIDDYITRGVDAIVITPISADGSLAALKKAKEAGITIICFNTCVNEDGIASAFLVTKNEDLGSTTGAGAVKFIEDQLGGKAVIGILNCDQFEGCPPRKEGFEAAVSALPGVEIVADQAGWIADDALPVSEAMLEANPTINLLWAANEGGTVAHALAVQSAGLAGKVFVFGTDMNNQMAQMLQADDDILQGVTGQAPYQMGYDAFMTMLKVMGGETVEPVINTPTIYFGRGDDEMINRFVETEGNAVFEIK